MERDRIPGDSHSAAKAAMSRRTETAMEIEEEGVCRDFISCSERYVCVLCIYKYTSVEMQHMLLFYIHDLYIDEVVIYFVKTFKEDAGVPSGKHTK